MLCIRLLCKSSIILNWIVLRIACVLQDHLNLGKRFERHQLNFVFKLLLHLISFSKVILYFRSPGSWKYSALKADFFLMYKACTHKKIMKYGMFGMTFLLEDHITPQSAHSMKSYSYQLWKMRCHLKCFQKMNSGYLRFFSDLMVVFVIKYICMRMASHLVQLAITGASIRQTINSKNQKFQ